MEAVERYGVLHGGAMAAWRLMRGHPFTKGGLDPVVKHDVGNPTLAQRTRKDGAPFAGMDATTNKEMMSY